MKVIKHLTLFLLLTVTVNAQNIMTSSPYSMFGIGEIVTGLYGSNSAMGGVSTGMRSTWLLNTENPAGLTGLDTLRLFAETSAFMKSESYQSKTVTAMLSPEICRLSRWQDVSCRTGIWQRD